MALARVPSNRPATYKKFDLERTTPTRKAVLGWAPKSESDVKRFVGRLTQQLAAATYNLPTIESVRVHFDGPIAPQNMNAFFGQSINPFGVEQSSPPPGAASVESTFAEPGKLQTFGLVCAIGFHLEPIPWIWTTTGNAFPTPETGVAKPISPDVFTGADLGAVNGVASTLLPAVVDFGGWQERAFYHMVRAYNLIWQFGSRTNIVRDSLRYTAYVPSNAQDGSASSSMRDSGYDINQGNAFYVEELGSPFIFLTMDRIRVGGMGGATDATNQSSFRPYRNDLVEATYGGAGVRAYLRGNTDFRKLTVPYLLKPGVPIGLRADVSDSDEQAMMQAWLSATDQLGGAIPATFTDFSNINSGAGAAGEELQLDNSAASETTLAQRVYFKFGSFKITQTIKGFELTDEQADSLKSVDLSTALMQECGVQMA